MHVYITLHGVPWIVLLWFLFSQCRQAPQAPHRSDTSKPWSETRNISGSKGLQQAEGWDQGTRNHTQSWYQAGEDCTVLSHRHG